MRNKKGFVVWGGEGGGGGGGGRAGGGGGICVAKEVQGNDDAY